MTTVPVEGESAIYDLVETPAATYPTISHIGSRATPLHMHRVGRAAKRVLDLMLATIALVLLAPIMLAVGVAICVQSPGAPLFGQVRVGRGGRTFRCWKFRSMHRDAEGILERDPEMHARYVANDFKLNCDEDPRVTMIGRVLRKTSLDELPQVVNVLLGQMSLVGPRPVVPVEVERCYGPWTDEYLAVRPGLTGPWQISGRNDIRYPERAVLDAHYVNTWTLTGDLVILARTPLTLIRKVGVA
jgi:lipopolysaccharide/colanic/teichoic acid biosynthesis glycosyltransferase